MLVYLDKRILNIFLWKYTNMAANFFVVLIPRDGVKTLYWLGTEVYVFELIEKKCTWNLLIKMHVLSTAIFAMIVVLI